MIRPAATSYRQIFIDVGFAFVFYCHTLNSNYNKFRDAKFWLPVQQSELNCILELTEPNAFDSFQPGLFSS